MKYQSLDYLVQTKLFSGCLNITGVLLAMLSVVFNKQIYLKGWGYWWLSSDSGLLVIIMIKSETEIKFQLKKPIISLTSDHLLQNYTPLSEDHRKLDYLHAINSSIKQVSLMLKKCITALNANYCVYNSTDSSWWICLSHGEDVYLFLNMSMLNSSRQLYVITTWTGFLCISSY